MTDALAADAATGIGSVATVLDVRVVTVRRGSRTTLDGVSLRVDAGDVVAVLGPNGAGKTTLMETIVGRVHPAAGKVLVAGRDVARHGRWCRARVGYAGQEIATFPTMTVLENASGWASILGIPRTRRRAMVETALEAMRLDGLRDRRVQGLSGGERRRVHCAMAILARPPLLLLDEPTAGVDPDTRRAILEQVRRLAAEGSAVVYTTHYLPEVEALDARVVLLREGAVVADATTRSLLDRAGAQVVELRWSGGRIETVESTDPARDVPLLLGSARRASCELEGLTVRGPSLDEVFDRLVGSGAHDAG